MEKVIISLLSFLSAATITHLVLSCVFVVLLIALVVACSGVISSIS